MFFASKESKQMFDLSQDKNLGRLAESLKNLSPKEVNNTFVVQRDCGGMDNGTYRVRVSALGRVFLDAGNADVAALLIEHGAKVSQKMAADLASELLSHYRQQQSTEERLHGAKKPAVMSENHLNLLKILSVSGVKWDDISLFSWRTESKQKVAVMMEEMFGNATVREAGIASSPPPPDVTPGEPTARLLGKMRH